MWRMIYYLYSWSCCKYVFKLSKFQCNQKSIEFRNFIWIMKKHLWTYWLLLELAEPECHDAKGAWPYSAGQRCSSSDANNVHNFYVFFPSNWCWLFLILSTSSIASRFVHFAWSYVPLVILNDIVMEDLSWNVIDHVKRHTLNAKPITVEL